MDYEKQLEKAHKELWKQLGELFAYLTKKGEHFDFYRGKKQLLAMQAKELHKQVQDQKRKIKAYRQEAANMSTESQKLVRQMHEIFGPRIKGMAEYTKQQEQLKVQFQVQSMYGQYQQLQQDLQLKEKENCKFASLIIQILTRLFYQSN